MEHAAEVAFERRNEDELNLVLQQCTMADRAVFDRIVQVQVEITAKKHIVRIQVRWKTQV